MMKVKVINKYRDKHTGTVHEINEEIEMTEKRLEEVNSTAFGVFVEKLPVKKPGTAKSG